MNADVIPKDIVRYLFRNAGLDLKVEPRLKLFEERLSRPSLAQEQVLHARAIAAFAQALLIAKDLGDAARSPNRLVREKKRVESHGKMRIGGEPAAHAQRIPQLVLPPHRRQADV